VSHPGRASAENPVEPLLNKPVTSLFYFGMLDTPGSEDTHDSRIASPFPSGLLAGAARLQAVALLTLFYGLVYGGGFLAGALRYRFAIPVLSALFLGTLMLLATALVVRHDASWRESLGLEHQPAGAMLGWSLLGFVGTYAVNIVGSTAYLASQGNLEAVMGAQGDPVSESLRRCRWGAILPIAAFVAVWEETVFRGFILGRLRASIPVSGYPESDSAPRRAGRRPHRALFRRGSRLPRRAGPPADDGGRPWAGRPRDLAKEHLAGHRRTLRNRRLRPPPAQGVTVPAAHHPQ